MPQLDGFTYGGVFPTTSAVRAVLEAQNTAAPHTGRPYSEAMTAGLSGGIALGYFTFEYDGYDPQVNIITRNTFADYGWDPLCGRLGLVQDVQHSTTADKARDKLIATLEEGRVPVVWADVFTLGYEQSDLGEDMWAMQPVVVTGYEPGGEATLADRSRVPIAVPAETLDAARARVKKEKHRLVTIDQPSQPDLRAASLQALQDAVTLFREKPPRGSANNWGAKGYTRLVAALGKPESAGGWLKTFPTGRRRFAAMTTAFRYALTFWEDTTQSADRMLFAEFLEELGESGLPDSARSEQLRAIAGQFREAGALWKQFGTALLPDELPLLAKARNAITERHESFLTHGHTRRLAELDAAYNDMKTSAETDAALTDDASLGETMQRASEVLGQIRDVEAAAFESLGALVEHAG